MKRVFLDTNVVIDILLEREAWMEDALQYFSAHTIHADVIITRNGKDFADSTIPIQTASDFLSSLQ